MSELVHIAFDQFPGIDQVPEYDTFHNNKQSLLHEHKFPCASPGCDSADLGVYHIANWCGSEWYDFDKMREFLHYMDPYGFSRKHGDTPITSVHDLRNLIVLCRNCHKERPFAFNKVPFPQFVMQACVKNGFTFEPTESD